MHKSLSNNIVGGSSKIRKVRHHQSIFTHKLKRNQGPVNVQCSSGSTSTVESIAIKELCISRAWTDVLVPKVAV